MPSSSSTAILKSSTENEKEELLGDYHSEENTNEIIQVTNSPANSKKQSNIAKLTSGSTLEEMIRLRNLKTSQNITESVPVPSSEHVAEIVGRQGCKIKALRAKTNTYIKTPIRGEQPQFVITGRKEDVITAKREIQLAADHFSQIRARRGGSSGAHTPVQGQLISSPCNTRQGTPTPPINTPSKSSNSVSSSSSSSISLSPPIVHKITTVLQEISSSISPKLNDDSVDNTESTTLIRQQNEQVVQLQPGQIITKVSVPYQVVGLVVGPRGTTIKRIQQNTNTYIVTPSRDSQPVFAIQGLPDNVAQAKIEIENYIQLRTNNNTTPTPPGQHQLSNGYSSSSSSSSSSTSDPTSYFNNNNNSNQVNSVGLSSFQNNDYEFFNNGLDIMDELKLTKKSENLLQESSIWSSPISTTFAQSEDCLVNSIQQNLNPNLNSINGIRSSLSSASSTSSSASSSFSLAKNDTTFQFFNNQTESLNGLINGIESMNIMSGYGSNNTKSINDPFLSTLNENSGYSASSSLSSSSSSNDNTHSIFQQHENLFNNHNNCNSNTHLISQEAFNQDFNHLYPETGAASFLTNFQQQQQPQYF
jgi:hypothetical protein